MKFEEIKELIQLVSDSNLKSFKLEEDGIKISMGAKEETPVAVAAEAVTPQVVAAQPVQQAEEAATIQQPEGNEVKSPLVGTFYAAPAEDAEPFVKVGDHVKKGQVLGIIEAMKLMNEIESEYDGVVEAVLVDNADAVEYGQPLFIIR